MDGGRVGGCPVEEALGLLAGKWRPLVLFRLLEGPQRFNALRRSLPPVTQRVLAATLRDMEADGLCWRRVDDVVPPRVTYGATPLALGLAPVFAALAAWRLGAGARLGPSPEARAR